MIKARFHPEVRKILEIGGEDSKLILLGREAPDAPPRVTDFRRGAIIFAFVLAAIITPTIDPVNQSLVALPLIALYEMSIWLAKLVQRKESRAVTPVSSPAS